VCSSLRELSLTFIASIDQPPAFPNLQRLYMETTWIKTPQAMTSLLILLERAPLLQDITLIRLTTYITSSMVVWDAAPVSVSRLVRQAPLPFPQLRSLCIADFKEHVHHLLQILPEPVHTLHIKIMSHCDRDPWSLPHNRDNSRSLISDIFTRIVTFWTNRAGQIPLPGGTVHAFRSNNVRVPQGRENTLKIESGTSHPACVSFHTRIEVHAPGSLVDQARTLHLNKEKAGPFTDGQDMSGSAYMVALQRLVISMPQTVKYLHAVEKWLKERVKVHGPLDEVTFEAWSEKLNGKIPDSMDRIQRLGLAKCVSSKRW
jgi:hypothetical protein